MICQNCGKENREDALYCEWCGVKLEVLNEKDQQFRLFLSRKEAERSRYLLECCNTFLCMVSIKLLVCLVWSHL